MKHLQLVCILSTIAIAHAGGKKEDKGFIEECRKETKASEDDVKMLDSDEFPKTKTQYCMTACYYKKSGVMNDDNTINIDKVLDQFAHLEKDNKGMYDKLSKVMKDCNTKYTPVKECDSIKSYIECMLKSSKEAGIPLEK